MSCQVCRSILKAGDFFCASCGAIAPEHSVKPQAAEVRGRIAGERKYLTVLCADLQRSTDLISELERALQDLGLADQLKIALA